MEEALKEGATLEEDLTRRLQVAAEQLDAASAVHDGYVKTVKLWTERLVKDASTIADRRATMDS